MFVCRICVCGCRLTFHPDGDQRTTLRLIFSLHLYENAEDETRVARLAQKAPSSSELSRQPALPLKGNTLGRTKGYCFNNLTGGMTRKLWLLGQRHGLFILTASFLPDDLSNFLLFHAGLYVCVCENACLCVSFCLNTVSVQYNNIYFIVSILCNPYLCPVPKQF